MPLLLQLNEVAKDGPGDFRLSGVTFSQARLEKIAIAGETGAGKSTVLKLIAGLLQPDRGELLFEKEKVRGPADQLVPGHPRIAYLSQHFELQKSLRVEQVLAYSNKLSESYAARLYAVCRIDHLLPRRTDELSGGEKQRVAICRLLISSPRLLLLDEPFSHLDMVHKNTLKNVIRDIGDKLKITCILVSHDPQDTLSWADRIVVMKDGRIIQQDTPRRIYQYPVDEYTGGLFGKYNLIVRKDYRLFSKWKPLKKMMAASPGKSIFIRPEQLKLARKSDSALRGRVEKISFYGHYSEAEVMVGSKCLLVRGILKDIREGQIVYLSASKGDFAAI